MAADILLVDGPHLIYRAIFTNGDLSYERNGEKVLVGGIWGFLNMLRHAHPKAGGTVVVTWEDPLRHKRSHRRSLYPEYKCKPDDEVDYGIVELRKFVRDQQKKLMPILTFIGIPQAWAPNFEADDVIATICKKLGGHRKITVLTGDKDLWALVNDNVSVMRPVGDKGKERYEIVDTETWKTGYGKFPKGHRIEPADWSLALALMGDSADNVPGVKGIGPAYAEKIIEQVGTSMDAIIQSAKAEQIKRFSGAICEMEKQLRLNVELTRLYGDAELEFVRPSQDERATRLLFREMKFSSFLLGGDFNGIMAMGGDGW